MYVMRCEISEFIKIEKKINCPYKIFNNTIFRVRDKWDMDNWAMDSWAMDSWAILDLIRLNPTKKYNKKFIMY